MFFRKECKECAGHKAEIAQLRVKLAQAETKIAPSADTVVAQATREPDLVRHQSADAVRAAELEYSQRDPLVVNRQLSENRVADQKYKIEKQHVTSTVKAGMSNRQWLDQKVADHRKRQAVKEQAYAQDEAANIRLACQNHAVKLIRNFRKCRVYNDYGALVDDTRHQEAETFLDSLQLSTRYLGKGAAIEVVGSAVQQLEQAATDTDFSASDYPDNGLDFEHWTAEALQRYGWKARVTQGSGDQGVDVIAEKDGVTLGIQCKRYTGSVGNKAIQEAYSGMKHFGLDKAAVLTNAKFTKSAKELAASTGVLLLSPEDIPTLSEWPELGT